MVDVQKHSLHTLVFRSLKRTHEMFLSEEGCLPPADGIADGLKMKVKARDEYGPVMEAVRRAKKQKEQEQLALPEPPKNYVFQGAQPVAGALTGPSSSAQPLAITAGVTSDSRPVGKGLLPTGLPDTSQPPPSSTTRTSDNVKALLPRKAPVMVKPDWHPPWKLYRVISGHTGWVRCIDVEPGNQWFCTGSMDRIVKIWDLASGKLKLSLTGHVSTVRAVKVSSRQPYLFSAGEDKQVKCWDLECNKVIRHYHGHLSAVYGMDLHPTIDVLVTCSRDATARVWDMRTKAQVHCLTGHTNTVASVVCQAAEPQIITGSHDATIRLWDLAAGRSRVTLTQHKKSIRALCFHPSLYMFASAAPDNIKQWKCPDGEFVQNLSGHNSILNALCANADGVLISGGDNGSVNFWDWKSGFCFQKIQTKPQPGSIDSESGIFALRFDQSGSRLLTAETDKTVKLYKEDETATEDTHPVLWRPEILKKKPY